LLKYVLIVKDDILDAINESYQKERFTYSDIQVGGEGLRDGKDSSFLSVRVYLKSRDEKMRRP